MNGTLGPRDLGELIRDTFTIYGKNFWRFVAIVAIVEVPLGIVWLIITLAGMLPFILGNDNTEALIPLIPIWIILILVTVLAAIVMQGALIYAISKQHFRQPVDVGQAYRFAWRRAGSLIGAGLLVMLAVTGLAITIIGIPAAIYFGVKWAFAWQAVVLEGHDPTAALARSSALVKHNWWRAFGITLLFGMIASTISSVLAVIPILGAIAGALLSVPIAVIGITLLYYDLRVKKEGYTTDTLANELELEATSTGVVLSLSGWPPRKPSRCH